MTSSMSASVNLLRLGARVVVEIDLPWLDDLQQCPSIVVRPTVAAPPTGC